MNFNTPVAVVGATGVVGREIVGALESAGHAAEHLTLLASERSEGEELPYGDDTLAVEKVTPESFRGVKIAIFATPADVSRTLAIAAQQAGAWVVDLSTAFRADPQVPLILPAINPQRLRSAFKGRIVRCPSPITSALVTLLEPLRTSLGVRDVSVTALMGASAAGERGVSELEKQSADLLSGKEVEASFFPHRLGFNLIPQVGEFGEAGETTEEESWATEAALLVSEPPQLSGTAIQVPTFFGHLLSLTVRLRTGATAEKVRELLKEGPGMKLLDTPAERIYPMPMLVTADDALHVGRIRQQRGALDGFHLVAAIDNAGRGAALNAVETAGLLAERG
ncbi:MAG: aspartate-semialdehyde dehydrogenase [Myxococcaceae bacterium]